MAEKLLVLVSGRGALTTLAGVPSVQRHVQAGVLLGLEVVVVYPPERRALGAEIRGLLGPSIVCMPADQFAQPSAEPPAGPPAELTKGSGAASEAMLVVAAEWYLSLTAMVAVRDAGSVPAFGRVCERGCTSVPIACVTREQAIHVASQLGTTTAASSLATYVREDSALVDLDSHSEQRLSDNVSTAHAEEKLIENLFGPQRVLPVLRLRPTLAPPLAELFNETALGPAGISAIKLVIGLAAAWILEGGSYTAGVVGAFLYFFARLVGASGIVLARASFADGDIREKLDLAGDTVLHIALLWALAGGPARDSAGVLLATVATIGVLVSTGVAYVFVLKESWEARHRSPAMGSRAVGSTAASGLAVENAPVLAAGQMRVASPSHSPAAGDEFVSRFVQRDGIAYALLFAAVTGNLDLFLLAAAFASHLFYVLWLLTRPRDMDSPMAIGRAA